MESHETAPHFNNEAPLSWFCSFRWIAVSHNAKGAMDFPAREEQEQTLSRPGSGGGYPAVLLLAPLSNWTGKGEEGTAGGSLLDP